MRCASAPRQSGGHPYEAIATHLGSAHVIGQIAPALLPAVGRALLVELDARPRASPETCGDLGLVAWAELEELQASASGP